MYMYLVLFLDEIGGNLRLSDYYSAAHLDSGKDTSEKSEWCVRYTGYIIKVIAALQNVRLRLEPDRYKNNANIIPENEDHQLHDNNEAIHDNRRRLQLSNFFN